MARPPAWPLPLPARRGALAHAEKWIAARVAPDLQTAPAAAWWSPVSASPPRCTPLAHAINVALGNLATGALRPATARGPRAWPAELADELKAGKVDTLVITAWNPVYALPVDAGLAEARIPRTRTAAS